MANETRDLEAFNRVLSNLDVQLSQSADGVFTVCTTAEPLFCFDGDSREELSKLVVNTLVSYAKHFYNLDLAQAGGRTEDQPIEESPVPVEISTPVSRLKPVFDLAA